MKRDLLRSLRHQRGLTIEEVARRAHLPDSTVGAIERGDIEFPAFDTVMRLCDALDLDPGLLWDGTPRGHSVAPEVIEAMAWDMVTRMLRQARKQLREVTW